MENNILAIIVGICFFYFVFRKKDAKQSIIEDTMIKGYSTTEKSVFINLITDIQKLNFNVEELNQVKVLNLCKIMDIVGEVPLHLRCWNNERELIIAIDHTNAFQILSTISMPKEDAKIVKTHELILNKMADSQYMKVPIQFKFLNSEKNTDCYVFTKHAYQYETKDFEACAKIFTIEVDTLLNNYFS